MQVDLRVGTLDVSLARLLTEDHHIIEFPTLLLPESVHTGSIVRLTCERDYESEADDKRAFERVQQEILNDFAEKKPKSPVLHIRNVTQTTVVLEWDPIDVASSDLRSLALYKTGEKLGVIPNPLKRTATKLSNLEIDHEYTFKLILATSSGVYESNEVAVTTQRMTDLSGITICIGSLENSGHKYEDIVNLIKRLGAKPVQDVVKLDTTHFVCTKDEGKQCKRAKDVNIPIVRPEWLSACEKERRLVGVRAYYISADPQGTPRQVEPREAPNRNSGTQTNVQASSLPVQGTRADVAEDKPENLTSERPDEEQSNREQHTVEQPLAEEEAVQEPAQQSAQGDASHEEHSNQENATSGKMETEGSPSNSHEDAEKIPASEKDSSHEPVGVAPNDSEVVGGSSMQNIDAQGDSPAEPERANMPPPKSPDVGGQSSESDERHNDDTVIPVPSEEDRPQDAADVENRDEQLQVASETATPSSSEAANQQLVTAVSDENSGTSNSRVEDILPVSPVTPQQPFSSGVAEPELATSEEFGGPIQKSEDTETQETNDPVEDPSETQLPPNDSLESIKLNDKVQGEAIPTSTNSQSKNKKKKKNRKN